MPRRPALVPALLACALCAGRVAAAPHVVAIERMAFVPATLAVRVGDVIEWRNEDVVPHTATAVSAGFDVFLAPQGTQRITIRQAGPFDVSCRFHPDMRMRLEVAD